MTFLLGEGGGGRETVVRLKHDFLICWFTFGSLLLLSWFPSILLYKDKSL